MKNTASRMLNMNIDMPCRFHATLLDFRLLAMPLRFPPIAFMPFSAATSAVLALYAAPGHMPLLPPELLLIFRHDFAMREFSRYAAFTPPYAIERYAIDLLLPRCMLLICCRCCCAAVYYIRPQFSPCRAADFRDTRKAAEVLRHAFIRCRFRRADISLISPRYAAIADAAACFCID